MPLTQLHISYVLNIHRIWPHESITVLAVQYPRGPHTQLPQKDELKTTGRFHQIINHLPVL